MPNDLYSLWLRLIDGNMVFSLSSTEVANLSAEVLLNPSSKQSPQKCILLHTVLSRQYTKCNLKTKQVLFKYLDSS